MMEDRLIKHKELYVDDIDQSDDNMKCNICEKEFPRLAIS
jgi:hypothetical protein